MANSYVTTCTEDEDGSIILDIPDGLLEQMGWQEGTELSVEAFAGAIILRECTEPQADGGISQQVR